MTLKNIFCIMTLILLSNSSLIGMWWGYRALEYQEEYAATHPRTWAETFDHCPPESQESKLRKLKEELFTKLVASTRNDTNFYFSLLPSEIVKMAREYYLARNEQIKRDH